MIRRIVFERHGLLRTDSFVAKPAVSWGGTSRTFQPNLRVSRDGFVRTSNHWLEFSMQTRCIDCHESTRYGDNATPELLVHIDRGTQFTSDAFQKQLADNKFGQRLSPIGDCWHTAAMESFFGTLKQELVYRVMYET